MIEPDQENALANLTPSEREFLLLLGRGHTAKSIGTLKGLSEFAINERFRSARRKTGLGSSREIARLLIAQETRDNIIGLGTPIGPAATNSRPDTPIRASSLRWRIPMSAAVLFAAAILAQQTATPPAPPSRPVHPAVASMFENRPPEPDFGVLHAEVGASQPDPAWSPRTEETLVQTFHALPGFSNAMENLTVTCSASLCEALGVMRAGLTTEETNEVMSGIQGSSLHETAKAVGLNSLGVSFSSTRNGSIGDTSTAPIFAAYWRRRS